jgi:hypothetical protein
MIKIRSEAFGGIMARINIFLPNDDLKQFDREAHAAGVSRSRLILKAVHDYLQKVRQEAEEKRRKAQMARACETMDKLAQKLGEWEPAPILRRARDTRYGTGWKNGHGVVREAPAKKRRRA